jgi:hypothetical protein
VHTDAVIATSSGVIHQLLGGQTTPADALQAGDITISGDTAAAHDFFTYFDPPCEDPIKLRPQLRQSLLARPLVYIRRQPRSSRPVGRRSRNSYTGLSS